MDNNIHEGVGLLITDTEKSEFFVQIKDNTYPGEKWRGACSFWGGAIEKEDPSVLFAVNRELMEEIPDAVAVLENNEKIKIDRFWVVSGEISFWLTLFVVEVSPLKLKQIADCEVLEGYGKLVSRNELRNMKWIWNMDFIFHSYINSDKNS